MLEAASLIGAIWALLSILILLCIDLFTKPNVVNGEEDYGSEYKRKGKRKKYLLISNIPILLLVLIMTACGLAK
jgi:hypothetical protein